MTRSAYDPLKRTMDVLVAAVMLVVTAPLQGVVAVLVRRKLGSPVLFRQLRPGRDEEIFELVKFRTMRDPDPAAGIVSDEARLTPFGIMLRSTSLDELPTLWNVIKGDMSLVGPRPLLVQYLSRYSDLERRRHAVRPGITGLAQVNGRNSISWQAKFEWDIEYVEKRSFSLDLRIILRTLKTVARRRGVNAEGSASMSEFLGSTRDSP